MNTRNPKIFDEFVEFGQFVEEVLNASGLPQTLVEQLDSKGTSKPGHSQAGQVDDPDDFLAQIYRNQE